MSKSDVERLQDAAHWVQTAVKKETSIQKQLIGLAILILALRLLTKNYAFVKQSLVFGTLVVWAEMINSCIERLCDMVQPEKDERIRKIKDIAAWVTFLFWVVFLVITLIDLLLHFYPTFKF